MAAQRGVRESNNDQCAKCSNFWPRRSYCLKTVKSDRLLALITDWLPIDAGRRSRCTANTARPRGGVGFALSQHLSDLVLPLHSPNRLRPPHHLPLGYDGAPSGQRSTPLFLQSLPQGLEVA